MLNDLNCVSCTNLRQKFGYYTSNIVSKQHIFFIIFTSMPHTISFIEVNGKFS